MKFYKTLFFLIAISAFLFLPQAVWCNTDGNVSKQFESAVNTAVKIDILDKEGKLIRQGTGFIVSEKGEVLACSSRFAGGSAARVTISSPEVFNSTVFNSEVFNSTGVLGENRKKGIVKTGIDTEGEPFKFACPAKPAKKKPLAGEAVLIPDLWAENNKLLEGKLETFGNLFKVNVSGPLPVELIGSPVFNLEGKVVGIVNSLRKGNKFFFMVPLAKEAMPESGPLMSFEKWHEKRDKEYLESPEILRETALYLIYKKRFEKALVPLKKLVKKDPVDADAYKRLGYCCGMLKRYDDTLCFYKKAAQITPEIAAAHHNLGIAYAMLNRFKDAARSYKKAVELDPENADARYNLGVALVALNRSDDAMVEYRILKKLDEKLAERLAKAIERVGK